MTRHRRATLLTRNQRLLLLATLAVAVFWLGAALLSVYAITGSILLGGAALALSLDRPAAAPSADEPVDTDAVVETVALALDAEISEFCQLRVSDYGYEADPREAARIAVEALFAAGWRPGAGDPGAGR